MSTLVLPLGGGQITTSFMAMIKASKTRALTLKGGHCPNWLHDLIEQSMMMYPKHHNSASLRNGVIGFRCRQRGVMIVRMKSLLHFVGLIVLATASVASAKDYRNEAFHFGFS